MKGFNFEKNLSHQQNAVESTLAVFENLQIHPVAEVDRNYINPIYNKIEKQGNVFDNTILSFGKYSSNIVRIQANNSVTNDSIQKTQKRADLVHEPKEDILYSMRKNELVL